MTRPTDRRNFLRAAGALLALPSFASLGPVRTRRAAGPRRLVCVGNPFGMHVRSFFPSEPGPEWEPSPLLAPMARHRADFTVFSNIDHGVTGGHAAAPSFLSGIRPDQAAAHAERNITLDQKAAELIGDGTRFRTLNLGVGGTWEMCWTRNGVRVPVVSDPRVAFDLLFVDETGPAARARATRLERQRSVLDAVREQARGFEARLGAADREKFDEYETAVRETERRVVAAREWLDEPKPGVEMARPRRANQARTLPVMFDLIALALQTNSTRVATLEITAPLLPQDLGHRGSYHKFSHHGKRPKAIESLLETERYQMEHLARFLDRLAATPDPEGEGSLLDTTMVLFGSGLGNGNSHSNRDLPILVAGGGFAHGQHVVCPRSGVRRTPLCDLFVTLLRRFDPELEGFGTSTRPLEVWKG